MKNQHNYKFLSSIRYWGAATSAHQVEGNNHNQWSVWELAHAKQLANSAEERLANWLHSWSEIKDQAKDPNNYVSGIAVDHYTRYEEDFDLLEELNMNAYRFSIEWSRIEPKKGEWNKSEIEHYRKLIDALKQRNIEPFVTLWHWTVPVWFEEMGGFTKKKNIDYFVRFCRKIMDELSDQINYVITVNEPQNYAWISYASGEWPPAQRNYFNVIKVMFNLVSAHKKVYKFINKQYGHIKVGSCSSITDNVPANPNNYLHRISAFFADYLNNYWYFNRTKHQHDFIGVNYYFKNFMKLPAAGGINNPQKNLNDLGWYMAPDGISRVLVQIHNKYKKPIYITENGLADRKDKYRKWWIKNTLEAINEAVSKGVIINGYFHWSLLDNFEWDKGFWPRFGLVEVDRKTLKRTIRPSAKYFAKIIQIVRSRSEDH